MTATTATQQQPRIDWRGLLVAGGLLIFIGGAMHGDPGGVDLPIREHLASTMAAGGWALGHVTMTIGAALLAGGVLAARRAGAWTLSSSLWRLVVAAVAATIGIIGGVCHAVSAPLAILTEDSSYEFLFPVAGIAVSLFWIATGADALRVARRAK